MSALLPRRPRYRFLVAALLIGGAAATARALEFQSATPSRDESGRLWVTARLEDPLEERVEKSLGRGMPATVELHAELWRKRSGWFDRMERASDAALRVRHDVWSDTWRLERSGGAPVTFGTLDSLEASLSRPIAIPVAPLDRVPPEAACYVVVTATVKPLDAGDAEEVEGWLSGEVQDQRRAGFGVITQLPRSVFDAVRNFAGFGDSRARTITPEFEPASLPLVRR